jgi:TonB family protein
MRLKILVLLIVTFCAFAGSAQTPTETPQPPADYRGPVSTSNGVANSTGARQISGGVLNGKAKSLPKPVYPPAARAVKASGAVTVQVLIDETGAVISATAINGHPLLREAATSAARGAVFSPTLLQGQPVKVSGVITYNFVLPMSLAHISFAVARAEETGSFGDYVTNGSIKSSLPPNWEAERTILDSLTFEAKQETTVAVPPAVKSSDRYTILGKSDIDKSEWKGQGTLDSRSREALKEFSNLLYAKTDGNQIGRWNFEFGRALGRFVTNAADSAKFEEDVLALESLAASVPETEPELADDVRGNLL